MIPPIILSKLATQEGLDELESLLLSDSPLLTKTNVYRGGITDNTLHQRPETNVAVRASNNRLVVNLKIPAKEGGTSITVIEAHVHPSDFIMIQKAMNKALTQEEIKPAEQEEMFA